MKQNDNLNGKAGSYIFLAAIAVAVLAGLMPGFDKQIWVGSTLAILGLIVGLLNITRAESVEFLVACIALLTVTGSLVVLPWVGPMLDAIMRHLVSVVAPATLVVGIKLVYELARD